MDRVTEKAKVYIMENGTELQKACCAYLLEEGGKDAVVRALAAYQNTDGGFAHGLDEEYTGPVSSQFAVISALGLIYRFGLGESELYAKTLAFCKRTQRPDGSWDDPEEMRQFPVPDHMGNGIYVEYKTGMTAKWLMQLGVSAESELLEPAIRFLSKQFGSVAQNPDFWNASAYSGLYSQLPDSQQNNEILAWCEQILTPPPSAPQWPKFSGCIEDCIPFPKDALPAVLEEVKSNQAEDGGWPNRFGTYYRVWTSVNILQFWLENNGKDPA